jgi:hypothetical protein
MLSREQAFDAMRRFLEGYQRELKDALVVDVLSDTQPAFFAETVTADPAAWHDSCRIVDGVLSEAD